MTSFRLHSPSRRLPALGAGLLLCAAAALTAPERAAAHPDTFAPLVRAQRSRVVHITTRSTTALGDEPDVLAPYRYPEPSQGTGTGFIVSADGQVVTNYHVVADTDDVQVVLEDGTRRDATVVGLDRQTDLALLQVEASGLPAVTFGDSAELRVGDWVVAIGSPLGLHYSVTAGIISAKGRNIFDADNVAYGEFLQTDAAINPGNSGGPLFDLQGRVVGVASAVSRNGQGIGFAVPSNLVVQIIEQLRTNGRVIRGWLGVVIQDVTPEVAAELGLPQATHGVLVNDVVQGAPAARSALQKGDLLVRYRETPLERVTQLQKLVAFTAPGSEVQVEALRRHPDQGTWRPVRIRVPIGRAPEQVDERDLPPLQRLGLSVEELTNRFRRRHDLKADVGVRVRAVAPDSPAARAGLRPGDIIVEADQREIADRLELSRMLREAGSGRLPLLVQRDNKVLYLVLVLPR